MESAIRKRNMTLQFGIDSAGYVSKEAFACGIKSIFGITDDVYNHLIFDIFTLVDGRGLFNARDDKLNKKELDFVIQAIPVERSEHICYNLSETIFNIVNKNKDGVLDINEFKDYITLILGSIKTSELKEVFKTLSKSTNGIQKEEFMKYCIEKISGLSLPEESKEPKQE